MAPKEKSKRIYAKNQEIIHDLFKLGLAKMEKNISRDGVEPEYIKIEHCHFYHSVDSKGAKQDKCTPIGGHFHIMEVVKPATGDSPAEYKCSGPKKFVLDKYKKKIIADCPGRDGNDTHTHEIEYLKSEKLNPAQMNPAAIKFIAQQEQAPETVPGIQG